MLRVRQICKKRERLVEVLKSKDAEGWFELLDGDERIRILYDVPPERRDSGDVWDDGVEMGADEEGDVEGYDWGGVDDDDERYRDGETVDGWGEQHDGPAHVDDRATAAEWSRPTGWGPQDDSHVGDGWR